MSESPIDPKKEIPPVANGLGLEMAKMHLGGLVELGVIPGPAPCPKCSAATEHWWSYCAMCGHHIAAGT
jgi:hypothetical protein